MNKNYKIDLNLLKKKVNVICKGCGNNISESLERDGCFDEVTYFKCNNKKCKNYARRICIN